MMLFRKRLPSTSIKRGEQAELRASQWLLRQGLKLVANNYCCRQGEIDLIMLDKNQLVFIEVRYRKNSLYGSGAESVTFNKQTKIRKAAQHFLSNQPKLANLPCRFDVVSAQPGQSSDTLCFDWIKNAFQ